MRLRRGTSPILYELYDRDRKIGRLCKTQDGAAVLWLHGFATAADAAGGAALTGGAGNSARSFSFGTPPSVGSTACVDESPSSNHAATAMLRAISKTNSKRSSMVALGFRWGPARVPL